MVSLHDKDNISTCHPALNDHTAQNQEFLEAQIRVAEVCELSESTTYLQSFATKTSLNNFIRGCSHIIL